VLCARPFGAADYAALAERYAALVLEDVPALDLARHDRVRRFLTLVDVLYDRRKLLAVTNAAAPIDDLLLGGGGGEVQGDALASPTTIAVRDSGGASGRPSTFVVDAASLGDDSSFSGAAEWSATGRLGASLGAGAELVDTHFAWARGASRVVEMTTSPAYRAEWRASLRTPPPRSGGGAGDASPKSSLSHAADGSSSSSPAPSARRRSSYF